jgi:PPM family protein phosphatase
MGSKELSSSPRWRTERNLQMRYISANLSEAGPRSVNEDCVGVWKLSADHIVAGVADGLGGLGGGDRASRLAIELLGNWTHSTTHASNDLRELAQTIHQAILREQQVTESRNMATTFTAVEIRGPLLTGVHCGDSRAAVARMAGIRRLTTDHSEAERLFRSGRITKEELADYPRKNILDSALGIHTEPTIDKFAFELQPGDRVFLTTDGVHGKVLLRELREISTRHEDPRSFVDDIGAEVEARVPDDNYSIVAIFGV